MLKRVRIQGYKSLVDVEVHLQPLSVLFGPNASGKSNFLDALQLLSRIATSKSLQDAFEPPYRGTPLESFTFGPDGIQGLLAKERITFTIEVDVELSQRVIDEVNRQIQEAEETQAAISVQEKYLRYGIEIAFLPGTGFLRRANERLTALSPDGTPKQTLLEYDEQKDQTHINMEGSKKPLLELSKQREYSILSRPRVAAQSPHLVAMRQELESWFFYYFEPRERMRMPTPVKEVRHIGPMGEELDAFFNTLRELDERHFKAIERALHVIIPPFTGIDVSINNAGLVELRLLKGQTAIPVDVLSEGTLRILGLLALRGAKEAPCLLGLEEPESGIDPERLDLVTLLLENLASDDTQVIVTTHSPPLLDLIAPESLYIVRSNEDRTGITPLSNWLAKKYKPHGNNGSSYEAPPLSERVLRGDFHA